MNDLHLPAGCPGGPTPYGLDPPYRRGRCWAHNSDDPGGECPNDGNEHLAGLCADHYRQIVPADRWAPATS